MSKKNPFHWYYGIPEFNPAHKFVYLNDLVDGPNVGNEKYWGIWASKQLLYGQAKSEVENIAGILNSNFTISNALDFLKNIADSERNKELAVIKNYEQYLKELLPTKEGPYIDKLLSKINGNILDNPEEISDFYLYLTKYINETRQSIKNYTARLESFMQHNATTMNALPKDDYRFRAAGDLQGTFTNLIGIATRAQKKETWINKVRDAAFKYITDSNLFSKLSSGEDIAAAFAVVQLDIQKKCQEIVDQEKLSDLIDLDSRMDDIINNYINASDEEATKLQKAIEEEDEEQIQMMLDAAKNILTITQLDEGIKARKASSDMRTLLLSKDVSLRKKIKSAWDNSKDILDQLQLLKVTVPTKSSTFHGNVFELIQVVQEGNTIKIRGNTGTDLIHLGSFEFDLEENPEVKTALREPFKNIENILTEFDAQKRKDRMDDQTKRYQQMNKEIQKEIKRMNEIAKKLDTKLDNLFVYHESLKLYKSAETNEMSSFEGRDQIILNYIDQLYAANNLAGLDLPEKDALTLLAMNLASQAVGANTKGTLENYLSIFAGLLMFDDVFNMAQEAQNLLTQSKGKAGIVKQIHLYNLNGIYVPASMVLTFTYTTMKEIAGAIEKGYAAKVSISATKAENAIAEYLKKRPLPLKPQWTILGNQVASGTTVRIQLLANFTQLLTALNGI